MPWRTRGACNTPENSRNFGYVMGLNGLGVIWFCYPMISKLFTEQASNLTIIDITISLLPGRFALMWAYYSDSYAISYF